MVDEPAKEDVKVFEPPKVDAPIVPPVEVKHTEPAPAPVEAPAAPTKGASDDVKKALDECYKFAVDMVGAEAHASNIVRKFASDVYGYSVKG